MRWPGRIAEPSVDPESLQREVLAAGKQALTEFIASAAARAPAPCVVGILERCQRMRALVRQLEIETPALLAAFEARLVERLHAALINAATGTSLPVDEAMDRVRQEVVLHGMRIDVAEELSRLAVHLGSSRAHPAGWRRGRKTARRMQELNREANTLGSKGANADLANAAIELKLLIEQIREQVQNLE